MNFTIQADAAAKMNTFSELMAQYHERTLASYREKLEEFVNYPEMRRVVKSVMFASLYGGPAPSVRDIHLGDRW